MFDEQNPATNLPPTPSNLPISPEPEDIFAKIEAPSAAFPAAPEASSSPASSAQPAPAADVKAPLVASRKAIMVGAVVLGMLVVAGIAFGVIRFVRRAAAPVQLPPPAELGSGAPPPEIPTLPEVPTLPAGEPAPFLPLAAPPEPSPTSDGDGDGVTDKEERERGTDPASPDSDKDGLFDGEEVFTYETDPLNSDTDADGHLDGTEVSNGYNPKGEGRLFTVPSAQ